jgi:hypothetical protein
MTAEEKILEARMHLECLTEAWLEYTEAFKDMTTERKAVVKEEIPSRIWAAIYLLQYMNSPEFQSDRVQAVIREANAFNGGDCQADISGAH